MSKIKHGQDANKLPEWLNDLPAYKPLTFEEKRNRENISPSQNRTPMQDTTQNAIDYKTMQAGRELDALVAEKVFSYRLDYEFADEMSAPCVPELRDKYDEWGLLPNYSTDVADAFEVVEKLKEQVCVLLRTVHDESENKWVVEFWGLHSQQYAHNGVKVYAETLPLAICRASLLALAATKQG